MLRFRCLLAITLFCLPGLLIASGVAQDDSSNQPQQAQPSNPPEHWRGHAPMDPARRTEMLTKHLGLTADQQPKVLEALKSEQSQMEQLHSDSSLSQDDRRAKMMEIRKATKEQIRSILTPDQQKKWEEMQRRREQRQGHRYQGQTPAPSSDSSDK